MTLRHIEIFRAVCENGCSTTRAAEALHMTQPAVSLAVRELERYYGVLLFDRIGRRLHLTEAGQHFLLHAQQISALFGSMEHRLRNWDALGVLRVGASITIGSQLLPGYAAAFRDRHPGIELHVRIAPSEQLEQKVLSGSLDLALIEGAVHTPDLHTEVFLEDHLTVICPADGRFHPGQVLTLEEFRRQSFLLREPGSGTREVFDRAIAAAGFSIEPLWEGMSTTALVNAVIHGLGIAVLPHRMVAAPLARGLVTAVTVEGLEFRRSFRIIHHRDKFLSAAARDLIDLCRTGAPPPPPCGVLIG